MEFSKEYTMLLPILFYLTLASATETDLRCSTCVKIEDICHNITHVLDFVADFRKTVVITKLGILNDVLYYAFEPNITDPEYYKVGYVSLKAHDHQGVLVGPTNVTNLRTFHFDKSKNVIYLGSGDGIYKSNNGSTAEHFSSRGDTILSIFFKRNLYFVSESDDVKEVNKRVLIQRLDSGNFNRFESYKNMKQFVIDFHNHFIFINDTGLYVSKTISGPTETVYLSRNSFLRGLTTDKDEKNTYAWWLDGIYKIVIDNIFKDSRLVKIADIPQIGAVTFDNDNKIMFTHEKGLYRLEPTTNTTKC